MISLLLLLLQGGVSDHAVDARIGVVDTGLPIGTRTEVVVSPRLDRAVSVHAKGKDVVFVLENGAKENRPVRWLGWMLPEGRSVLVAERGEERKLLVGGEVRPGLEGLQDALLVGSGKELVLLIRTKGGMVIRRGGMEQGPYGQVRFIGTVAGAPAYVVDGRTLRVLGRQFPVEGVPGGFTTSPDGESVAWVERLENRKVCAVVNGRRGPRADAMRQEVRFSPDGKHWATVFQDGANHRVWMDGRILPTEGDVAAAEMLDGGVSILSEVRRESAPKVGFARTRGRLVIGGRAEERELEPAVLSLERHGASVIGVSRGEKRSIVATVTVDGRVAYDEIEGRVGRIFTDPKAGRRLLTVRRKGRLFVLAEGREQGPYDWADQFSWLEFTEQFAFVASRDGRVRFVAGSREVPVALTDFAPPLRMSDTEMTAVLAGTHRARGRKEIWTRVVRLE